MDWFLHEYLCFILFLWLIDSLKNFCCRIVWFWYQMISSFFGCYKLDISMSPQFLHSFSKDCIVHQLKKYFSKSFLAFFLWIAWHIPPLILFPTINNISISVDRSNFTLVFFKATCHANPVTERKWAELNPYISRHFESC